MVNAEAGLPAKNPARLAAEDDNRARSYVPDRSGAPLRYLKVMRSVRLSVEAPAFNGSLPAFALC